MPKSLAEQTFDRFWDEEEHDRLWGAMSEHSYELTKSVARVSWINGYYKGEHADDDARFRRRTQKIRCIPREEDTTN